MEVLVTGITGYVGSRLARRLMGEGHSVRGLSRHPPDVARAGVGLGTGPADLTLGTRPTDVTLGASPAGVRLVTGDAVSGAGLEQALDGVEVAYYLIHSMEPSRDGAFDLRERAAAENFARAAAAAGVRRIVYLGGLIPSVGPASQHLASRLAVEEVLLEAVPDSLAFRASIVIGAGSRSFRFLVRLVERLPVLAVPAWGGNRTRPIDERDVIELLARAAGNEAVAGRSLDIGGPDVVTYRELIDRIRESMLVGRPTIGFKRLTATPIASRIAAVIADEEYELIGPLMESLDGDLLPRDDQAAELLGVRLHPLDRAIEHALREWESTEPLAAR